MVGHLKLSSGWMALKSPAAVSAYQAASAGLGSCTTGTVQQDRRAGPAGGGGVRGGGGVSLFEYVLACGCKRGCACVLLVRGGCAGLPPPPGPEVGGG